MILSAYSETSLTYRRRFIQNTMTRSAYRQIKADNTNHTWLPVGLKSFQQEQ